ncbi:TldD/PmbA family protein [Paenibacillus sp. sgz500958]|uniref:TldD/PmbA family protein n=1 Tax=Paenibacillus sp. sgz500958 TaxID=3242475 RepID=UPI0036D418F8
MNIGEFQQALFTKGYESGFTEMEIYYASGRSTSVSVRKGEIDTYTIVESGGLSFRGLIHGKMGYASTERMDQDSIAFLLKEAAGNAEAVETEDLEELFAGSSQYAELVPCSDSLIHTPAEKLIEASLSMEKAALESDPRIHMVRRSSASVSESEVLLANTKGLNCHRKNSYGSASLYMIAKENNNSEDSVTGGWFDYSLSNFDNVNPEAVAEKGVQEALSKLGATSLKSDAYPVILRNDAATQLLSSFTSIFSGEAVEQGFSRLKGKLGEQIAGTNVSLIDDPLMANTISARTFDAEGSATARHEVIKDGKLLTFLHNRKTARKAGVESTGNAAKNGYKGQIEVSHHNLYIAPGGSSLSEMIQGTEQGLMIVELQGLHSGTDATSGNFSLAAVGHYIEKGVIVRPVNQITISGNFFELLNEIECIGNDPRFIGSCTSPSLKLKSLSVSGS